MALTENRKLLCGWWNRITSVVLGTTGESVVLIGKKEKQQVKTIVMANAGKLPLVFSVGGNNTAGCGG